MQDGHVPYGSVSLPVFPGAPGLAVEIKLEEEMAVAEFEAMHARAAR